ncbi:hypothetical protein BYT27DRAFT_7184577 [Phlegmacium glaucopus]|nr:hypothetical protein BYT27DRAFT_7184577 [Phlegmacium glaucopus]
MQFPLIAFLFLLCNVLHISCLPMPWDGPHGGHELLSNEISKTPVTRTPSQKIKAAITPRRNPSGGSSKFKKAVETVRKASVFIAPKPKYPGPHDPPIGVPVAKPGPRKPID